MVLELLAIQIITTLLIDYTGVVDDMLSPIVRWVTGSRIGQIGKPLSCSLCSCWWASFIYLLVTHQLGLWSLVLALVFSCTTDITLALFHFTKDIVSRAVETISNFLGL